MAYHRSSDKTEANATTKHETTSEINLQDGDGHTILHRRLALGKLGLEKSISDFYKGQ
jgi:hypothetical protein